MTGLAIALLAGAGATLLLSCLRRVRRPPLVLRLAPFTPGAAHLSTATEAPTIRTVLGPLADTVGERLARLAGADEPAALRLERIHDARPAEQVRLQQVGQALAAAAGVLVVTVVLGLPPPISLLATLAAPVSVFLLLEQRLARASARWQRQIFRELPTITEQLATLLAAGWSTGTALQRLAERGQGCCSRDLVRVTARVRHGLSEVDALHEWAELADVEGVRRVVAVLALSRETTDLGRLLAEEARSVRQEAHRQLLADIERRTQQVWIPVTVATLVPGVLFLAVPFLEAMRLYAGA